MHSFTHFVCFVLCTSTQSFERKKEREKKKEKNRWIWILQFQGVVSAKLDYLIIAFIIY